MSDVRQWYRYASCIYAMLVAMALATPALAQQQSAQPRPQQAPAGEQAGESELAKKTQNPVSDLISVPFQNNFNLGMGYEDKLGYLLNVQPVYPMSLTKNWNLIHRAIIPVQYLPEIAPGVGDEFGLGDIQYQAFFSPSSPRPFVWGVGPMLQFPTATQDILGTDKWSVGPAAVALQITGPWVYGALLTYLHSFAGDDQRQDVSVIALQYFVNYNFLHGWYLASSPINVLNFEADDDKWIVPLGGGFGKIVKIGPLPMSLSLQGFYNVAHPDAAPDATIRFQFSFLFPRSRPAK